MEICVFKVYVGNSFCKTLKEDEDPPYESLVLPEGYDSIFLRHPRKREYDTQATDKPAEQQPGHQTSNGKSPSKTPSKDPLEQRESSFKLEYLIYSPENVVLTHIIRTKFQVNEVKSDAELKCRLCHNFP